MVRTWTNGTGEWKVNIGHKLINNLEWTTEIQIIENHDEYMCTFWWSEFWSTHIQIPIIAYCGVQC